MRQIVLFLVSILGVVIFTAKVAGADGGQSQFYCLDMSCHDIISNGKTLLVYSARTNKHLSFKKNDDVVILSKPTDKSGNDWVGKIRGKIGLIPKDMLREDRMNKPMHPEIYRYPLNDLPLWRDPPPHLEPEPNPDEDDDTDNFSDDDVNSTTSEVPQASDEKPSEQVIASNEIPDAPAVSPMSEALESNESTNGLSADVDSEDDEAEIKPPAHLLETSTLSPNGVPIDNSNQIKTPENNAEESADVSGKEESSAEEEVEETTKSTILDWFGHSEDDEDDEEDDSDDVESPTEDSDDVESHAGEVPQASEVEKNSEQIVVPSGIPDAPVVAPSAEAFDSNESDSKIYAATGKSSNEAETSEINESATTLPEIPEKDNNEAEAMENSENVGEIPETTERSNIEAEITPSVENLETSTVSPNGIPTSGSSQAEVSENIVQESPDVSAKEEPSMPVEKVLEEIAANEIPPTIENEKPAEQNIASTEIPDVLNVESANTLPENMETANNEAEIVPPVQILEASTVSPNDAHHDPYQARAIENNVEESPFVSIKEDSTPEVDVEETPVTDAPQISEVEQISDPVVASTEFPVFPPTNEAFENVESANNIPSTTESGTYDAEVMPANSILEGTTLAPNIEPAVDPSQATANVEPVVDPSQATANVEPVVDPSQDTPNVEPVVDPNQATPNVELVVDPHQASAKVENHGHDEYVHTHSHSHDHDHDHSHSHSYYSSNGSGGNETSSILLVVKHLSSTLLSFLPEHLQDTILDVDDALVFTGIIALTLVSICVPYFFIEGFMSVRPLKRKVVELNKSLWKVSTAYENQQEEFEIFKKKALDYDEDKKRVEQLEAELGILKNLEAKQKEQVRNLKKELKSSAKVATEVENLVETTMEKKAKAVEERDKLKTVVMTLQEALNKTTEQLEIAQSEASTFSIDLELAKHANENLTCKITAAENEMMELKAKIKTEIEIRQQSTEECETLTEERDKIREELVDLKEILHKYEETVSNLNQEIGQKENELMILKDSLGEDSPLVDIAETQAKLKYAEEESVSLQSRIESVTLEKNSISRNLEQTTKKLEIIQAEKEHASNRLAVLEAWFKEKEEELRTAVSKYEAERNIRGKDKDDLVKMIEEKADEVRDLTERLEALKDEFEDTKLQHRNEIRAMEAKSHENWLSLCQAERKAQDARKDAEMLRQKLTAITKEKGGDENEVPAMNGEVPFYSMIPPELVPPPIPDITPSYFGLGDDFMPPPPLPLDGEREPLRPPPLGRLSPTWNSDLEDNPLSPIRRRGRRDYSDGSSRSGSRSPPRGPPSSRGNWSDRDRPPHHDFRRNDLPGSSSGHNHGYSLNHGPKTSSPIQHGANL